MRKTREKTLQDERFKVNEGSRGNLGAVYSITGESHGYFEQRLTQLAAGTDVLEIGCGNGAHALDLSKTARSVTGIDISDVAVEIGEKKSREAGVENAHFITMDAEQLQFPDSSFGLICGVGILHHLDLQHAYSELARTLTPGGRAVFLEPLGYNPFINLFRRLTPSIRTPDEHPLLRADLDLAKRYFRSVEIRYYYLTTLLTVPVSRTPIGKPLVSVANAIDRALFAAIPPVKNYAWMVLMEMSGPIK